ncbi:MAG: tetratricopeptide (TPR) repeat protein, partial [Cyclobacteriaceae bacterium]
MLAVAEKCESTNAAFEKIKHLTFERFMISTQCPTLRAYFYEMTKVNTLLFCAIFVALISCDTREIKRDRFFLQGNFSFSEREYRTALTHYTNAITVDNDFALAYNNRAVTLVALDRSFEAIQDYNQALLINPSYVDARYNRATAYEETKQYAKSLEDVNQLVEEYPDSIQYLFFKGIVLTHLNELSEAASVFSSVWERDGSNIEALINVANVAFYQGHFDASLQLLEEAISIDPNQ